MTTPRELQSLYKQGVNITELLRREHGLQRNTDDIIEIAYDLQTGSYITALENAETSRFLDHYTSEVVAAISSLCKPESILEAGVGEATTLSGVMRKLGHGVRSYGFDLSWSRVAYARRWLQGKGLDATTLCTGNLFHIPFADNSIDVVYTSHSIEPNGGHEKPILEELFRVARKYLLLFEPGYELANDEAKARMDHHGYCRNLKGVAEALGYTVLRHQLLPQSSNPLNPTAITIVAKQVDLPTPSHVLACPKFKTPLKRIGDMMFSPEALVAYPVVGGIPCLRVENGVFASKYEEIMSLALGGSKP